MVLFRPAILTIVAFLVFGGSAAAQKKTPKKPTKNKPIVSKTTVPPLAVRVGREKVEIQLGNVNKFIDLLGPIAQAIESLDETAKTRSLPKTTADKNEANKQKVIAAIRNLRAGLSDLESEFRTTPDLQKYLPNIKGITDLAANSEDLAIAGKFIDSKGPLRQVAQLLNDTLAAMPLSPAS